MIPYSEGAERGVLGAALLSRENSIEVMDRLRPDDFYLQSHTHIFQIFLDLKAEGKSLNPMNVNEKNTFIGWSDIEEYCVDLADSACSPYNINPYILAIIEKSRLRKLHSLIMEIGDAVEAQGASWKKIHDRYESPLLMVMEDQQGGDFADSEDILKEMLENVDRYANGESIEAGYDSGFPLLDGVLGGIRRGSLITLAGRPGSGKTALALNVMANLAIRKKIPTLFFSMEMPAEELLNRIVCSEARIDTRDLERGLVSDKDMGKLIEVTEYVNKAPIEIAERGSHSLSSLRSVARTAIRKRGVKFIIIDYLQLMRSNGRNENRNLELGRISGGLKALAKELDIPILMLSQMNRGIESRSGFPNMSDLRDSGSIEQDSDSVIFIHQMPTRDDNALKVPMKIVVAKNRHGPTGLIDIFFEKRFARFMTLTSNF